MWNFLLLFHKRLDKHVKMCHNIITGGEEMAKQKKKPQPKDKIDKRTKQILLITAVVNLINAIISIINKIIELTGK